MKYERKSNKKYRRNERSLSVRVHAPNKSGVIQTLLGNARSSSRWTLAERTYARKIAIWELHPIAILSWAAHSVVRLAQKATWCDVNQGPEKSRSYFWRDDDTWKTSALDEKKICCRKIFASSHTCSEVVGSHQTSFMQWMSSQIVMGVVGVANLPKRL